ncbi:MAG: hypothetical protein PHV68_00080 [Candidatus Gastranaerophilales bacterium]|nr:hypothetical protein [Candidatus Gastranaerophilales bacterium]
MLKKRIEKIKEALKKEGISQGDIARELSITSHAVWFWVHGRMSSKNITEWFRNRFGEEFLKEIELN